MKKTRAVSLAAAFLMGSASLGSAASDTAKFPGEREYREKYKNVNFSDVKDHWSKDAVLTMGSLGIIKGIGQSKYNPNGTLTKEDSLLLLVRMLGLESEAQREAAKLAKQKDTAGHDVLDSYHYAVKGAIKAASDRGIIDEKELSDINPLTEADLTRIEAETEAELQSYRNLGLTQAQLKNIREDIREKTVRKYTWKQPANRETVVYWLGRAIRTDDEPQNIQAVYTFRDSSSIKEKFLPFIESAVQKGYVKGDDTNRFNPKKALTRAEMAQIIYNAHEENLKSQGYKIKTGLVEDIRLEAGAQDGKAVKRRLIGIVDEDGNREEIYAEHSESSQSLNRGILTLFDGLGDQQALMKDQRIKYYISPNGEVVLAKKAESEELVIKGAVQSAFEKSILLKSEDGKVHRYNLSENLELIINGKKSDVEQIISQMEGTFTVSSGKVRKAVITAPEGGIGGGGNIAVGDYFETGILVSNTKDSLKILKDGEESITEIDFSEHQGLNIERDGKAVSRESLKLGECVTIFYLDTENTIAKISASTHKTRVMENTYKGKISNYNRNRNQLSLSDTGSLNGLSRWESESGEKTIPISDSADIYVTDEFGTTDILISRGAFENYMAYKEQQHKYLENAFKRSQEVYLFTEKINGREEATRIILKKAGEYRFSGKVAAATNGMISVHSNPNIYYDNSTIVLKEGKLQTPHSLNKGDTVTVYTHEGKNTAAVIVVEGKESELFPLAALVSKLEEADPASQTVTLKDKNAQKISGAVENTSESETLSLSQDAKIELLPEKVTISQEEFFERYFSEFKGRRVKLASRENGEIVSMQIYGGSLNTPEFTYVRKAKVEEKDLLTKTLKLSGIRTHSERGWITGVESLTLDFSNAIVISEGRSTGLDRIYEGSYVDIVTDVNTGHILIVR